MFANLPVSPFGQSIFASYFENIDTWMFKIFINESIILSLEILFFSSTNTSFPKFYFMWY